MQQDKFPFQSVQALSGSAQQHGSVFWAKNAEGILRGLDPSKSMVSQFEQIFAVQDAPIWMDSTTKQYCHSLEKEIGGPLELAQITGSKAYERFTGNQIAKIVNESSDKFHNCERISLLSSFGASIFLGEYAPIDVSDGSGMNLLDIHKKTWSQRCLDACAPNLINYLGGEVVCSTSALGKISPYFQSKYGFSPNCEVIAWSGDNPNSLAGIGVQRPGDIGVSLGTSDTLFAISKTPSPAIEGSILINPVDINSFMVMLVYKNGSLARERIRDSLIDKKWDYFNSLLQKTPCGNNSNIGIYLFQPEITPSIEKTGIWRFNNSLPVSSFEPEVEVRAIVESQFLLMRLYYEKVGVDTPQRIIATGGGSVNHQLLQILSNVFGIEVFVTKNSDSASLGASFRAVHGWKANQSQEIKFGDIVQDINFNYARVATPNPMCHDIYSGMLLTFSKLLGSISNDRISIESLH